ncbi:hypothetical protein IscW_ISCW023708 [Ixodes scapularis]|uniref:Uncharacterized protein n=1 Tax=Ixodes scapularis TaxID=6945 RepID=B7QKE5_IXOSC|nr:hypothetical protein IscW_ISCW023708 [Ixodes scapularis]|eukprot:XP_002415650.1 hypothetical protein IscW_ISCW023708 [Ixodes scapularis]
MKTTFHFVFRRWRNYQPRPEAGQHGDSIRHPSDSEGIRYPLWPRPLNHGNSCWLYIIPFVHPETHEAGGVHQERFKPLSALPTWRSHFHCSNEKRPDLPKPQGLIQPRGGHAAATDAVQGLAAVAQQTPSTYACCTPVAALVAGENAPLVRCRSLSL